MYHGFIPKIIKRNGEWGTWADYIGRGRGAPGEAEGGINGGNTESLGRMGFRSSDRMERLEVMEEFLS